MATGLAVSGIALATVGFARELALALVLIAAVGAARSFFDVAARTLLQRAVKDDVLARVFGLEEGLQMWGWQRVLRQLRSLFRDSDRGSIRRGRRVAAGRRLGDLVPPRQGGWGGRGARA
ncbi:MAG: hypothetical protein ABI869_04590 [Actinomycetota bacterium]